MFPWMEFCASCCIHYTYMYINFSGIPKAICIGGYNLITAKGKTNMNYLARWQRPEVANWRLTDLRDEIDRLFEAPLAEFARSSRLLSGWTPALDVYEDKDNVYVKAELPGMKREDIEVSLHDHTLSVSGERKT